MSLHNLPIAQRILQSLNGKKHILIKGNHDKHGVDNIGFDEVFEKDLTLNVGKQRVLLNHYRISDSNQIVLHGHDHTGPVIQGMNINLNCDLNYLRPYSEKEVEALISEIQGKEV